jgi:NAD(P)-dependent dehydrogenase (short-subunit alcohol dehydrogenase family)
MKLRPLQEQVIVITGASSGIGLVTAKMAAQRGARVVLAARNGKALDEAVQSIRDGGGRAVAVVADVTDRQQVQHIAAVALETFGQIDTWVNNAAVSVYGRLDELDVEDMRRQFDVNYWGQVYGSLVALPLLRERGGALIHVASVLADRAIPLQGNYCAAKHALKAFTETLRMEVEAAGWPIAVTLLKPGSTDTPFFQKAKTVLGVEPQPVPPVHAPEVVAEALLHCAAHPMRDLIVGGTGKLLSVAEKVAPRLTDKYMERPRFMQSQATDLIVQPGRPDNLYQPMADDGGERGWTWRGPTRKTSAYTWLPRHPALAGMLTLALGTAAALLVRSR